MIRQELTNDSDTVETIHLIMKKLNEHLEVHPSCCLKNIIKEVLGTGTNSPTNTSKSQLLLRRD